MAIQKITVKEFLQLSATNPVLDVRSPGEFTHAHIPGAFSLPLFTDEERKIVGTSYKQQSRETAIKTGLDFFGPNMRKMVEAAEALISAATEKKTGANKTILIHCWRGGMRSAAVAWLLDLYGFKIYTLTGGYKAYRHWVRESFEIPAYFNIVGGYTGSGKTLLIHELKKTGHSVVDLEALANHKGSAFGAIDLPQPNQEMFENLLAKELSIQPAAAKIWMEDESNRIGNLNIPVSLWKQMRSSPVYFLEIAFEKRLEYLVAEYGSIKKEQLVNSIIRIQKRLGGLDTKNAINFLLEDDLASCFRILLRYYDKCYGKALQNRENLSGLLNKIPCESVDTMINLQNLLHATILEKTV
ncbi:MAG: tRNA 2-selenouridine(34) synthase MnmH [Ferruginibacter sp.]